MAGGADFLIDIQATLRAGDIDGAEDAVKAPFLVRQDDMLFRRNDGTGKTDGECGAGQEQTKSAHHAFPPPRTDLLMLSGNGKGRSSLPRTGRITRKWAK